MAIYSLKQRIFIVKRFYQNGNSTAKVKNDFTVEYNDKPTDENIVELVELFENFGSVLINNDTQIKLEMNADSINLEGDPEESSYNSFEIKSEQIDNAVSCDEMDPLKCSETASDGNLTAFLANCDNPKFDVSIGVGVNYPMSLGDIDECPVIKNCENNEKDFISEETNDNNIPCSRCDEKFKTKLAHSQHIEQHAKQCDFCKKKFLNLDEHMAVHTKERLYQCTKCNLKFCRKRHLKAHNVVHSDEKPYACDFPGCSKSFKTTDGLNGHKRTHLTDSERPHKCEICRKGFLKKSALKLHVEAHAGEKHFVCNICGAKRSSKRSLMSHMRTHTGGEFYKQESAPRLHVEAHTGEKYFVCNICGVTGSSRRSLMSHMREHTDDKSYKEKSKFTYANEKLHLCDICGKSFGTRDILLYHRKNVHAKEKLYECLECGKKFSNGTSLKKHNQIHTRTEGSHKCLVCGKKFCDISRLKKHNRIHTGEKPYSCSHCSKTFTDYTTRGRHERTHTGERPYKCGSCGKTFSQPGNLKAHMKNVKCSA